MAQNAPPPPHQQTRRNVPQSQQAEIPRKTEQPNHDRKQYKASWEKLVIRRRERTVWAALYVRKYYFGFTLSFDNINEFLSVQKFIQKIVKNIEFRIKKMKR